MTKKELPYCPYCGKKLNYLVAFSIKNQGEYLCDGCGKSSNINHERATYILSWVCELISVIILSILFIFTVINSLVSVLLVFIPFLIFYIFVPFNMVLKPCRQINKNDKKYESIICQSDDDTIIMDELNIKNKHNKML